MVDLQLDAAAVFMDARARLVPAKTMAAANCIACGQPIREDRLQAVPGACRCTYCQEHFEGKEARHARVDPRRIS